MALSCSQSTEPLPADINRARQLWQQSAFNTYMFDFRQDCNCLHGGRELSILVINNKIESIADTSGHTAIDSSEYKWYFTIDQLFDRLVEISRQHTEKFEYTFDADYGYPRTVFVDFSVQVADDEFSYTIGNLKGLTIKIDVGNKNSRK